MDTVLVVQIGDGPDQQLLRTTKEHVSGTEKEILYCRIVDEKKFQNNVQRQANSERQVKSVDEMEAIAKTGAEKVAKDVFSDDVAYKQWVLSE